MLTSLVSLVKGGNVLICALFPFTIGLIQHQNTFTFILRVSYMAKEIRNNSFILIGGKFNRIVKCLRYDCLASLVWYFGEKFLEAIAYLKY